MTPEKSAAHAMLRDLRARATAADDGGGFWVTRTAVLVASLDTAIAALESEDVEDDEAAAAAVAHVLELASRVMERADQVFARVQSLEHTVSEISARLR